MTFIIAGCSGGGYAGYDDSTGDRGTVDDTAGFGAANAAFGIAE